MNVMDDSSTKNRVSFLARIVPALALTTIVLGSGASAFYLRSAFWAMRDAESASVAAIAGALAETNLFVLVAFYLAIVLGFAGVIVAVSRLFVETKTSSPSLWFFLGVMALGFPAPLMVWTGESLIIKVFTEHIGIVESANMINLLTLTAMIAAPILILLLAAASLWPFSSQRTQKWGALVGMLAIELALIIFAIAFQVRTSWLYQVKELEHF